MFYLRISRIFDFVQPIVGDMELLWGGNTLHQSCCTGRLTASIQIYWEFYWCCWLQSFHSSRLAFPQESLFVFNRINSSWVSQLVVFLGENICWYRSQSKMILSIFIQIQSMSFMYILPWICTLWLEIVIWDNKSQFSVLHSMLGGLHELCTDSLLTDYS